MFLPHSAAFKNFGCCPARQVQPAQKQPVKWLGIARALDAGLCTLNRKEKICCIVLIGHSAYCSKQVLNSMGNPNVRHC